MAVREVRVGAGRLERWLAGFVDRHGATDIKAGPDVVELVGGDGDHAWIDVPYPPLTTSADGPDVLEDLVAHALRPRLIGVLLVRRGGHAAGLFDGDELIASKVGSSYVQGSTKAGGWSQQRYARRRANQASAAFAGAADAAVRVLTGTSRPLDGLRTGGDRDAIRSVLADPRLTHLTPTGLWLEVKDPRLRTLRALPEQLSGVRVRLDP